MVKSLVYGQIKKAAEFRPFELGNLRLPYAAQLRELRQLAEPITQPLGDLGSVRKVRARVRQELEQQLEQHRDQIVEGQSRIDQFLETARRHSQAQPVFIHEPLEQAIDWIDDFQHKVGEQLSPSWGAALHSPWCGSVDKRLKGLAPPKVSKVVPLQQHNWQALLQSQMAQTVSQFGTAPNANNEPNVSAMQQLVNLPSSLAKMTGLPSQLRETRDQLQRQVDRLMGVRPPEEVWQTQFPEDEDPPQ